MLNCSIELNWDSRLEIISEYIQLLVNSGHRYPFIKSVILQAVTKYKFMLKRAKLDENDIRYRPLYRARTYDQLKRKVSKMVEGMTWFREVEVYDKFRNGWKSHINYRQERGRRNRGGFSSEKSTNKADMRDIVSAMFVPASRQSLLLKYIMDAEKK